MLVTKYCTFYVPLLILFTVKTQNSKNIKKYILICFLFALKVFIIKWKSKNHPLYLLINQHQTEILYWLINTAWSYSATYFENKIVMSFLRKSGLKENRSGFITQMHYMEILVLQNVTTHVIYCYSEYHLHYIQPSFPKSLSLSVHAAIYLPVLV